MKIADPASPLTSHSASEYRTGWRAVHGSVWALGFVSMLMDISSEMIHALLPLYMVTVLGTSVFAVGLIEGIAEATASVVKIFSGALSDRLGKRKLLAFYDGKVASARWWARNVLPGVGHARSLIERSSLELMELADEAF
mgnify:CR=1 FL=1